MFTFHKRHKLLNTQVASWKNKKKNIFFSSFEIALQYPVGFTQPSSEIYGSPTPRPSNPRFCKIIVLNPVSFGSSRKQPRAAAIILQNPKFDKHDQRVTSSSQRQPTESTYKTISETTRVRQHRHTITTRHPFHHHASHDFHPLLPRCSQARQTLSLSFSLASQGGSIEFSQRGERELAIVILCRSSSSSSSNLGTLGRARLINETRTNVRAHM